MKEDFLWFVWKYQRFDKSNLLDDCGNVIEIYNQGLHNHDSGPDFSGAKIKIGSTTWAGDVEIHVKSTEWNQHQHQNDPAFNKAILHVVWENNGDVFRNDGSRIPVLELKDRIDPTLINKYKELNSSILEIPCSNQIHTVPSIFVTQAFSQAVLDRINYRTDQINELFYAHNQDFEETIYSWLASSFGFSVNKEPFKRLASCLPYSLIRKYKHNLFQLEALLFGASGLIDGEIKDEYHRNLLSEFKFLQHKHNLNSVMKAHEWKFSKLRPPNFPTIRISQFCSFLHRTNTSLLDLVLKDDFKMYQTALRVKTSPYWETHFTLEKSSGDIPKQMGKESANTIIVNAIVPFIYFYGRMKGEQTFEEKALTLLDQIKPESNNITKKWQALGISISNMSDSQASIELYKNKCTKRKCLDCAIGGKLLS